MSEPIYYERALAPILGISRDDLVYLRGEVLKKKKTAWWRDGRDIVIAQSGLDLILARLRATSNRAPIDCDFSSALVPVPEQKEEPPRAGETQSESENPTPPLEKNGALEQLTVVRCYPNPRMLQATTPAGEQVDVRVKTNKNFVPRMQLRARLVTAGKYEMEGRCPRTRGRY